MNRFNSELPRIELPEPPRTNWLSKYHLWGYAFLFLTFLLIVSFIYQMEYNKKPQESRICIQVVTTARSPYSGETKEFPTPCDVPEGWEVVPGVYNEIPGLEITKPITDKNDEFLNTVSGSYSSDMYGFEVQFPNSNSYTVSELDAGGHSIINFNGFSNSNKAIKFSVELITFASSPDLELKDFKFKDLQGYVDGTMAGKEAYAYANPEVICDQSVCEQPFVAYATKKDDTFYVISFNGDEVITEDERKILDSFKFK